MLHLMLHSADPSQPLAVSFEQVISAMETWPQMFCEPDGWFDWTSPPDVPAWQIAGQLHDRGKRLSHVEAKFTGLVPIERFEQLLAALGWPTEPLMFQLVREAAMLDEAAFRERFPIGSLEF